ncbi:hypothetical protein BDF20DRAFT_862021 [Mycotypha africana]|uniref:uncharacterized protein n=1 Tax=Mycotypha africana TaxID=64632 RepID=UPI00230167E9|nr:uncharacterized protein BDF20DRAFT_862021 [Mycotypha africana]KAI8981609.1 hypothetical protein BDF20DRAFT_862021 [Mycotypha africana]
MSELSKYSTSQQNDHASTTSSDKLEPSNDISATMERKLENQLKAVRKYETDIQTKQNDHKRLLDETKVQQEIHGQLEELKEKLDNSHVAKSSDDDNPDDILWKTQDTTKFWVIVSIMGISLLRIQQLPLMK